jgi:hypothetical protein
MELRQSSNTSSLPELAKTEHPCLHRSSYMLQGGPGEGFQGMAASPAYLTAAVEKPPLAFLPPRMPSSRVSYCIGKRKQQVVPPAVSLEKDASDETTPNACGHVRRLAADGVKREVAVYMCIVASVHAVARHFARWNSFFLVAAAKSDNSNGIILLVQTI